MTELIVATKNKKKLEEIREILRGLDFKITSLADYPDAPRIIENGKTFQANALKKAQKIARFTGKLVMGEDSGICVKALGGSPGIYSARYAGKNKSDMENNLKLLKELKGLPLAKRGAYYACAVALADASGIIAVVEGRCSGRIGYDFKGTHGFGYDPLFIIPAYRKTFGELGSRIKHKISHRFRALEKARRALEKYIERSKVR